MCYGERHTAWFSFVAGFEEKDRVGVMYKKLHLVIGTVFAFALFVVFHAVLAVTTIFSFVFLIPGMLLRWSMDEHKASQLR